MRENLILALASRLGQVIDGDLARSLVMELFPIKTYLPEWFESRDYKGYSFQCEAFADALGGLHELHKLHYEETEAYLTGIAMDPNYKGMNEAERDGRMIQFTVRSIATGEMVGNMRIYISRSMHNQELFATEDTFFIVPEHRGGFMAVRFWQYVEEVLRHVVGIRGVAFDSKLSNRADSMAKYLKYKPVSIRHVKTF